MFILDIAVFATADANWQVACDAYIAGANYHLANYDMRLNVYPVRPNAPVGIPLIGEVYDPPPDFDVLSMRPGDLRAAAGVVLPQPHGIPVIFCKFHQSGLAGKTIYQDDRAANRNIPWLNYLLLRDTLNEDRGCLLHELLHAANYQGDTDRWGDRLLHDTDTASIMRKHPIPGVPVVMYERHAQALRTCYFVRSV